MKCRFVPPASLFGNDRRSLPRLTRQVRLYRNHLERVLSRFYRLCGHLPHSPIAPTGTLSLKRDQLLILERTSGVAQVAVPSGSVWITGSPATADIVLAAGDGFVFENSWPYVLQAMSDCRLVLMPGTARKEET